MCICYTHICIYVYIYIYREREREREIDRERDQWCHMTIDPGLGLFLTVHVTENCDSVT